MREREKCDAENCGGSWHYEERDGVMVATDPCPVNNPGYASPRERAAKRREIQEQRRKGGTPRTAEPEHDDRWWAKH